jgi:hypothetical protein
MVDIPTEAYALVLFTSHSSVEESDIGRVVYPCLMGYKVNCNKTLPDANAFALNINTSYMGRLS